MNKRTYEILAKWIAKQQGVSIEFLPDICPQANIKAKHIKLPSNVKEENVYGALADLMHEANHLNHTAKLPDNLVTDKLSHGIFNAIEDIRIDQKNFYLLPNVFEFYDRGLDFDLEKRKEMVKKGHKIPLHQKVLCNGIYELENMPRGMYKDKETLEFEKKHQVIPIMAQTTWALDNGDWQEVKDNIAKIMKIFGFDKLPKVPMDGQGQGQGQGNGSPCPACGGTGKEKKNGQGQGSGQGTKGSKQGEKECSVCGGTGELSTDTSNLRDKEGMWATGQGSGDCIGTSELGQVAVEELTRNKFKEILNIKETKIVEEGTQLDTDNLTAFFTGAIGELFKEEKIVHKKKSKILILMDASGSMGAKLLDGSSRRAVTSGCVEALADILEEVKSTEGINVEWIPRAFTSSYKKLDRETWKKQYARISGGTNLLGAFNSAMEEILADQECDGNKLIVVFSDGDVYEDEITGMRDTIVKHGADVRCMVIGIGSDIGGAFSKELIGDNIILAKESADLILLETIMTMLGG